MTKIKYISFKRHCNFFTEFVLFPETIIHSSMKNSINPEEIIGAGFVQMKDGKFECIGESDSLGIGVDDKDSTLINLYFK